MNADIAVLVAAARISQAELNAPSCRCIGECEHFHANRAARQAFYAALASVTYGDLVDFVASSGVRAAGGET